MERKPILKVKAEDCEWQYFRGSGKGGQARNKTSNAVRCVHRASGAVGVAKEGRSQRRNRQLAFKRMANSEKFRKWLKVEVARIIGVEHAIRQKIDKEVNNPLITRIETKHKGKWRTHED